MAPTSQVTTLFAKSVVTSDVSVGEVTAEFVQSAVHVTAGGGGAIGGPCMSPPSARATPNRETMRMEIAINRLSSFIVFFVLFIERSLT
jgi:hypothetical protein